MASSYPGAIPVYPTHVDFTEFVTAADMNNVQNDIVAIATTIGSGTGTQATNPLYSAAFNQTFMTLTARLSNAESSISSSVVIDHSAGDITISAPGDAQAAGSTGKAADASHRHGREAFSSTVSSSAVSDSGSAGVSAALSRGDHKHARETWAATLITTTSNPGDSASNGTSTAPARADHLHGRESGDIGWRTVTLHNGWQSGFNGFTWWGYRLVEGLICFRGHIYEGTSSPGTLIGTLFSTNYAPLNPVVLPVLINDTDNDNGGGYLWGYVEIDRSSNITIVSFPDDDDVSFDSVFYGLN
jgi:hypothetical protein